VVKLSIEDVVAARVDWPAYLGPRDDRPQLTPAPQPDPPKHLVRPVMRPRWRRRPGPLQIGGRLDLPASTVRAFLVRCRINRLTRIDRVTGEPLRRYEHDHPGSLIHVDVTKFGNIPDGGGHRYLGRQQGARNNELLPACRATLTATHAPAPPSCTRRSTATPASLAPRSTPTKPPPPPPRSCTGRWPGSPPARRQHRTRATGQRVGLPCPRLARHLHRAGDHPETDPPLPTAGQRQDRAIPPALAEGWAHACFYSSEPCDGPRYRGGCTSTVTTDPTAQPAASRRSPG
jgi:hypothetical protein